MTREEAQALAEELVLKMSRESFTTHGRDFQQIGSVFAQGIMAHASNMLRGGDVKTNSIIMLAACSIELLREAFLLVAAKGATPDQIRAEHAERGMPS